MEMFLITRPCVCIFLKWFIFCFRLKFNSTRGAVWMAVMCQDEGKSYMMMMMMMLPSPNRTIRIRLRLCIWSFGHPYCPIQDDESRCPIACACIQIMVLDNENRKMNYRFESWNGRPHLFCVLCWIFIKSTIR